MPVPSVDLRADVEQALRAHLGRPALRVTRLVPVGGGSGAPTACVETEHGRFFAKWSLTCDEAECLREAAGLASLRAATSTLVIPEVLLARARGPQVPGLLLTSWLDTRAPRPDDAERLAHGLAQIHLREQTCFGWDGPSYCGGTHQDNTPDHDWPRFYGQRRLAPLVERVAARRGLTADERRTYDLLIARLPEHLGHRPAASLVHGDLWAGNVLTSSAGPALVDPACAQADREFEFGIATLFGGFDARFWDAYQDAAPLLPEWRARLGLYQLYHLLNHHLLFGGGYGAEALALARRHL